MASVKSWIRAARPRTVLLSFSGVLMGSFLALKEKICYPSVLIFAAITAVMLQILSNLANDYGDYTKGIDNTQRIGPKREMQSGNITKREMQIGIALTGLLCAISGCILLFFSFIKNSSWNELAVFAALGVAAILAALFYTLGKHPYGYRGLGDLFCFIFFGWAAVAGTYYLATKNLDFSVLLPASAMGFMSNAVLNINNMRDYESDKASGKNSLVVKIGLKKAFAYHAFLIVGGFICLSAFLIIRHCVFYTHLFWLLFPLFAKDLKTIKNNLETHQFDPLLPKQVRNTFLLTLVFGILFLLH
ncbi:MAG: 1,4-dihydroxy-2-naphthoate octaprenyltransferase [Bacteroidales bacterium]|nr:1,4-dihydroxy-2-naphthoate octaprenyltransferase [Bacteroidales bacterium]